MEMISCSTVYGPYVIDNDDVNDVDVVESTAQ